MSYALPGFIWRTCSAPKSAGNSDKHLSVLELPRSLLLDFAFSHLGDKAQRKQNSPSSSVFRLQRAPRAVPDSLMFSLFVYMFDLKSLHLLDFPRIIKGQAIQTHPSFHFVTLVFKAQSQWAKHSDIQRLIHREKVREDVRTLKCQVHVFSSDSNIYFYFFLISI